MIAHALTIALTDAPTRLVTSDPNGESIGFPFARLALLVLGFVLITLALIVARAWRQRRIDPRELAFRSLSKRMGLTSAQISSLRERAQERRMGSPIGLLIRDHTTTSSV